jgi:hypothetical protein
MIRKGLTIMGLWAAAMAGPAAADKAGAWTFDLNDDGGCYLGRELKLPGGGTASVEAFMGDKPPQIILTDSTWKMPAGAASVDLWLGGKTDRAADLTARAQIKADEVGPYVVVDVSRGFIERLAASDVLTVRIAGRAPESFPVGPAGEAGKLFFRCYDTL